MPLRDHFHPPVSRRNQWHSIHGMWPAVIVQQLKTQLPPGYFAAPVVYLGSSIELDIGTFEDHEFSSNEASDDSGSGGVATAVASWTATEPNLVVETDIPDDDEFAVRIYHDDDEQTLVAVIEIVSPANKDPEEKRRAFVGKCANLLRKGVAVSIVDLVLTKQFNLYAELLQFLGQTDRTMGAEPPPLYAISCRWRKGRQRAKLEAWSHVLNVGQPLPTLPLWLAPNLVVPLDLEQSYEKTCDDLSIR